MLREAIKKELKRIERPQAWLARQTGIPEASISIYLRTGARMSVARVEKIFVFLGLTVNNPGTDPKSNS